MSADTLAIDFQTEPSVSNFETLLFDRHDNVVSISLNNPKAKNALTHKTVQELAEALARAAADDTVSAVVLTGEGGAFSAGADISVISSEQEHPIRIEDDIKRYFKVPVEIIAGMEKPVIAAIEGPAAGISMSYALSCDLVVMAENAFMMSPFANINLVPDGGATWLLVNQLGYRRAYEFFAESQRLPAAECRDKGLANRVVADGAARDEAIAWGKSLAEKAPMALGFTKRILRAAENQTLSETLNLEAAYQTICSNSEDAKEAMKAFFEKRKPVFKGC